MGLKLYADSVWVFIYISRKLERAAWLAAGRESRGHPTKKMKWVYRFIVIFLVTGAVAFTCVEAFTQALRPDTLILRLLLLQFGRWSS